MRPRARILPQACMYVGDEPRDIMAATQAGYGGKVAVATGPATFGYLRDHPEHQTGFRDEIDGGAD